jgi:hypothetical protein
MGGSGSGHWYRWSKKPTTDNFWQFKIQTLKKEGLFKSRHHCSGSWKWLRNGEVQSAIGYELNSLDEYDSWIRVHYTNTRTKEPYDYKIRLSTSRPNYGGVRWWFHCPVRGCGRRVVVLYMGNVFGCRHCYNIAYCSQNQAAHERFTDRAFALAQKLGHEGNVIDGFWGKKPKGMHWKTYERKVVIMNYAAKRGVGYFVRKFGSESL